MEKEIKKAAKEYAKKVLGNEQYATNKKAVKSICDDFIAGANSNIKLNKIIEHYEKASLEGSNQAYMTANYLKTYL